MKKVLAAVGLYSLIIIMVGMVMQHTAQAAVIPPWQQLANRMDVMQSEINTLKQRLAEDDEAIQALIKIDKQLFSNIQYIPCNSNPVTK